MIVFDSTSSAVIENSITNNVATVYSKFINHTGSNDVSRSLINGNLVSLYGGYFLKAASSKHWFYNVISNNRIVVEASLGETTDVIDLTLTNTYGGVISGNFIQAESGASVRYAFNGKLENAVFTNNWVRRTSGVNITAASGTNVPNAAQVGLTTSADDGALLKTHNVIITS